MRQSFDTETWPVDMRTVGADIHVGELSMRAESCRRKLAFYLDEHGRPVTQTAGTEGMSMGMAMPVLVTRLTRVHMAAGRAVLHVDAALPLHSAVVDLAFPGNEQSGARSMDITVVDLSRHRRTLNAVLPQHVTPTGTVMIALRAVPMASAG